MDSSYNKHDRMDDVIRDYYGGIRFGNRRRPGDLERKIRGYYAPADRREVVLRNYYGGNGDVIKHHYHRLHHVLGNYYGQGDLYHELQRMSAGRAPEAADSAEAGPAAESPAGANVVLAKSFDDGETLMQRTTGEQGASIMDEYIVDKALEAEGPCEEYVVYGQSQEEDGGDEYVVYSQSEEDAGKGDGGSFDLDAYDKQVLKELNIDIANPLAQAKSGTFRALDAEEVAVEEVKDAGVEPNKVALRPGPSSKEDSDLLADIQSIMNTPVGATAQRAGNTDLEAKAQGAGPASPEPPLPPSGHAIFDRIAKSMHYANAYDLGTMELDNRFSDFDKFDEKRQVGLKEGKGAAQPAPQEVATSMDSDIPNPADFIKDLDSILKGDVAGQQPQGGMGGGFGGIGGGTAGFGGMGGGNPFGPGETFLSLSTPKLDDPAWPPKPTNIRPYTSAERKAKFGDFQYESDPGSYDGDGIKVLNGWDSKNVVMVDIPQLSGLKHAKVQFNKQGATQLQELWKAWEDAKLLDRVISFDGSYAARFIRHTEDSNPRPVSNHAWGTAFDINADQNSFGSEPALVGHKGSVRELVEIANEHGFYWGGHFSGHKDGMHFELGKMIS